MPNIYCCRDSTRLAGNGGCRPPATTNGTDTRPWATEPQPRTLRRVGIPAPPARSTESGTKQPDSKSGRLRIGDYRPIGLDSAGCFLSSLVRQGVCSSNGSGQNRTIPVISGSLASDSSPDYSTGRGRRRPVQPEAEGMGGLLQLPPAPRRPRRPRRPNALRKTATKDSGPACHRPPSVTHCRGHCVMSHDIGIVPNLR